MRRESSWLLAASLLLCIIQAVSGDIVQDIQAALDKSVDPCDDFYQFSCGGWISSNPLPADESSYAKSFSTIDKNNKEILKNILENQNNGTLNVDERLITLYNNCMDRETVEVLDNDPIDLLMWSPYLIDDVSDFSDFVARWQTIGAAPLFEFGPVLDSKNPNITIAQFSQGGLYLPDASLYDDEDIIQQYTEHIADMFTLYGEENIINNPLGMAKLVVAFESKIAHITVSPDQLIDPFQTYNKIDRAGLKKLAPQFDWDVFFEELGHPNITDITVDVPEFYVGLGQILAETDTVTFIAYLQWGALHTTAPFLPSRYVNATFDFYGRVLEGLDEQSPLWERCVELVDDEMGMLLGQLYVKEAFSGDSKEEASTMIESIEAAMKANLETISWMDSTTRQLAITKLSQVSNQIGSPSSYPSYNGLDVRKGELLNSVLVATGWNSNFQYAQIGKPSDKNLWEMTPATVNAYYDPTKNGMVFPAGIMQPPFFDYHFAPAIYFGGMGMIMGHELTHGFDNQGRDYDGQGVLRDWWLPATSKKFDELTACVINQYSSFEVLPGVHVNGNLTQGENIADMGGTKLSYMALLNLIGPSGMRNVSVVPGFTNEQLFFVAYAQGWCSNQTPEYLRIQVLTNPHSPSRFRVIGPLLNHPYFAKSFNCPAGSFMNPPDSKKCAVW